MRAVVQRVTGASVSVAGEVVAEVGQGLLILVCAMAGDDAAEAARLAAKIAKLRVFRDTGGKMNLSVRDVQGAALVVSQFTLAADLRGNRPGFSTAAEPEEGRRLYEVFAARLAEQGVPVSTGQFGAEMAVRLVNDGPVTIWMDTESL